MERVNHPAHYGGADNPFEVIEVIEAWGLGFNDGNAVKYIARAGKKDTGTRLEDLQKALWYLRREVSQLEAASLRSRVDRKDDAKSPQADKEKSDG